MMILNFLRKILEGMKMNRNEILGLVIRIVDDYFELQDIKEKGNEETVLFGKNSILDSMGLVTVIIDIESRFAEEDIEISLTSEKAMSRRQSPFRTISTLAAFIEEQTTTNGGNNE